jgi:hypothetical protein
MAAATKAAMSAREAEVVGYTPGAQTQRNGPEHLGEDHQNRASGERRKHKNKPLKNRTNFHMHL